MHIKTLEYLTVAFFFFFGNIQKFEFTGKKLKFTEKNLKNGIEMVLFKSPRNSKVAFPGGRQLAVYLLRFLSRPLLGEKHSHSFWNPCDPHGSTARPIQASPHPDGVGSVEFTGSSEETPCSANNPHQRGHSWPQLQHIFRHSWRHCTLSSYSLSKL